MTAAAGRGRRAIGAVVLLLLACAALYALRPADVNSPRRPPPGDGGTASRRAAQAGDAIGARIASRAETADASLRLVVSDESGAALAGVRVIAAHAAAARWLSTTNEPAASTDRLGRADVPGEQLTAALLLAKRGFRSAVVADPAPGTTRHVTLTRAARITLRVVHVDTDAPVAGVRVALSRQVLPLAPPDDGALAGAGNAAVFTAVSDERGNAVVHTWSPGRYHVRVRHRWLRVVEGLDGDTIAIDDRDAEHRLGLREPIAAALVIDGDELVTCRFRTPPSPRGTGPELRWLTAELKEELATPLVAACFATDKTPPLVEFQAYLAHSGWRTFPVSLQPLRDLEPVRVPMPARGPERVGRVRARLVDPAGSPLQNAPGELALELRGRGPLPSVSVRATNGQTVAVPPGRYAVTSDDCTLRELIGDRWIDVDRGRSVDVDVRVDLREHRPCRVSVLGHDGGPLPGAFVNLYPDRGRRVHFTLVRETSKTRWLPCGTVRGSCRLFGVAPITAVFEIPRGGRESEQQPFECVFRVPSDDPTWSSQR